MFKRGDKVITKDHTRYWSLLPWGGELVEAQPTQINGGREGTIVNIFDDGFGGVTYEVVHSLCQEDYPDQGDYREYTADEIEKVS